METYNFCGSSDEGALFLGGMVEIANDVLGMCVWSIRKSSSLKKCIPNISPEKKEVVTRHRFAIFFI